VAFTEITYPTAWRPDPGDVIEGVVKEIEPYDGGGYGSYPIVTLETDSDEEVAIHAFHTALRNELARKNVQPEDRVRILYGGKRTSGDGKTQYESYKVKLPDRAGQKFDWSGERAAAEEDDPTREEARRLIHEGQKPIEGGDEGLSGDTPF
jgi:hypothetical protein